MWETADEPAGALASEENNLNGHNVIKMTQWS